MQISHNYCNNCLFSSVSQASYTHTDTRTHKAGLNSLVSLSQTVQAFAVLVDHTSTNQPFIVPSIVVMEKANVAQKGGEVVAKGCEPCKAPPWLASLNSHTLDSIENDQDLTHTMHYKGVQQAAL